MAYEKSSAQVTAIVSAYNEERDIAGVLRELSSYGGFKEVIVVDDGSSDATAQVAQAFPVRLLRHAENLGKGRAMQTGVDASSTDILFFCDADIRGLTHEILDRILAPVVRGESDMVIAMRNWRMYYAGFVLTLIPILGGQRAVTKKLWHSVPAEYRERFMVESALNFYARYWGSGYQYMVVPGLKQTIKEAKYGFWTGLKARMRMSAEVLLAQIRLQLTEVPHDLKTGRTAFTTTVASLSGALLGAVLLFASYTGPAVFVRELYADELLSDPDTPFINTLLFLTTNISVDLIALIGVLLIVLNTFFALLNIGNLRYLAYGPSPAQRIG